MIKSTLILTMTIYTTKQKVEKSEDFFRVNNKIFSKDKFLTKFSEQLSVTNPSDLKLSIKSGNEDSIKLINRTKILQRIEVKENLCIKKSTEIFSVKPVTLNCDNSLSFFRYEPSLKKINLEKKINLFEEIDKDKYDCFNFDEDPEARRVIVFCKFDDEEKKISKVVIKVIEENYELKSFGEINFEDKIEDYEWKKILFHKNPYNERFILIFKKLENYNKNVNLRISKIDFKKDEILNFGDKNFDIETHENLHQEKFINIISNDNKLVFLFTGKNEKAELVINPLSLDLKLTFIDKEIDIDQKLIDCKKSSKREISQEDPNRIIIFKSKNIKEAHFILEETINFHSIKLGRFKSGMFAIGNHGETELGSVSLISFDIFDKAGIHQLEVYKTKENQKHLYYAIDYKEHKIYIDGKELGEIESALISLERNILIFTRSEIILIDVLNWEDNFFEVECEKLDKTGNTKLEIQDVYNKSDVSKAELDLDYELVNGRFDVIDGDYDYQFILPLTDNNYMSFNNWNNEKEKWFDYFGNVGKIEFEKNFGEVNATIFQGTELDLYRLLNLDQKMETLYTSFPSFYTISNDKKSLKVFTFCEIQLIRKEKIDCKVTKKLNSEFEFEYINSIYNYIENSKVLTTYSVTYTYLKTSTGVMIVKTSYNQESKRKENFLKDKINLVYKHFKLRKDRMKFMLSLSTQPGSMCTSLLTCSETICDYYQGYGITDDFTLDYNIGNIEIRKFGQNTKIVSLTRGRDLGGVGCDNFFILVSYEYDGYKKYYYAYGGEGFFYDHFLYSRNNYFQILILDDEDFMDIKHLEGTNIFLLDEEKPNFRLMAFRRSINVLFIRYFFDIRVCDFGFKKVKIARRLNKSNYVISGEHENGNCLVVVIRTTFDIQGYSLKPDSANNLNNMKFYEEFPSNYELKDATAMTWNEIYRKEIRGGYRYRGTFLLKFYDNKNDIYRFFLRNTNENVVIRTGDFKDSQIKGYLDIKFSTVDDKKVVKIPQNFKIQSETFSLNFKFKNSKKKLELKEGINYLDDILQYDGNYININIGSLIPNPDTKKFPKLVKKASYSKNLSIPFTSGYIKHHEYHAQIIPLVGKSTIDPTSDPQRVLFKHGNTLVKEFTFDPIKDLEDKYSGVANVFYDLYRKKSYFTFMIREKWGDSANYIQIKMFTFNEKYEEIEKHDSRHYIIFYSTFHFKHQIFKPKNSDMVYLFLTGQSYAYNRTERYFNGKKNLLLKYSDKERLDEIHNNNIAQKYVLKQVLRLENRIIALYYDDKLNEIIQYKLVFLDNGEVTKSVEQMKIGTKAKINNFKCRELINGELIGYYAHCVIDYAFSYDEYIYLPINSEDDIKKIASLKQSEKTFISDFPFWIQEDNLDYIDLSDDLIVKLKFTKDYYSEIGVKIWELKNIKKHYEKEEKQVTVITDYDSMIPRLGFGDVVVILPCKDEFDNDYSMIKLTRNITFWDPTEVIYNSSYENHIYVPSLEYLYLNLETTYFQFLVGKGDRYENIFFNEILSIDLKKQNDGLLSFLKVFGYGVLTLCLFSLIIYLACYVGKKKSRPSKTLSSSSFDMINYSSLSKANIQESKLKNSSDEELKEKVDSYNVIKDSDSNSNSGGFLTNSD